MDAHVILAINPGSTSTKICVYHNSKPVFLKTIRHRHEDLRRFTRISDQFEYRRELVLKELRDAEIEIDKISVVVGRGGLIQPVESGVYAVNERMKADLRACPRGEHASNLGALIADDIARSLPSCRAYIADPVVVDEMQEVARVSGHPQFERVSIFHALNQKAIARTYANSLDMKYEEINVIVAHMGGGISVGAHARGRVIDVNNALNGEGPFSPERLGTAPAEQLARLCFSGEYTYEEVVRIITEEGGLMAHIGTNDAYELELMARGGDPKAKLLQDAMAYNVAKHIGQMAVVLKGDVHGIILTGGIAFNCTVCEYIKAMVSFIAPVAVYPGEDEMRTLAMNGLGVVRGDIMPKEYR